MPGLSGGPTGQLVHPGGAVRSMLYGAFSFAPRLREFYEDLANDLLTDKDTPFTLPSELSLRLAATSSNEALVMGSVAAIGILPPARTTIFVAACFFRPLAWALVHSDELGDTAHWLDISDWTNTTTEAKASALIPDLPSVDVPLIDDHGWVFTGELETIYRGTLKSRVKQ